MMKKAYQTPQIKTTRLNTESILCGSPQSQNSSIEIQENERADGGFMELNLRSKSIWE